MQMSEEMRHRHAVHSMACIVIYLVVGHSAPKNIANSYFQWKSRALRQCKLLYIYPSKRCFHLHMKNEPRCLL